MVDIYVGGSEGSEKKSTKSTNDLDFIMNTQDNIYFNKTPESLPLYDRNSIENVRTSYVWVGKEVIRSTP